MSKKDANQFAAIIAARQQEAPTETPAPTPDRKERTSKRGNPEYSPVTVYIPLETYARAQFEMTRRGRKREMSELFTELLTEWLERQQ
jgi:hypothetical protein